MFPENDEKTGLLSKGSDLFILSLFCQLEAEYFISTHTGVKSKCSSNSSIETKK